MSPSNFNEQHRGDFPRTLRSPRSDSVALLIVDVQPEFWSGCPQVRKDFWEFPVNLEKTIDFCRRQNAKIIWIRADYNFESSPWLVGSHGKGPHRHRVSS